MSNTKYICYLFFSSKNIQNLTNDQHLQKTLSVILDDSVYVPLAISLHGVKVGTSDGNQLVFGWFDGKVDQTNKSKWMVFICNSIDMTWWVRLMTALLFDDGLGEDCWAYI